MKNIDQTPAGYRYTLPPEAIRQAPLEKRDTSNLLVYRAGSAATRAHFFDLPSLLSPGSVLVLNDTRVVPARLPVLKPTGGKAELLITARSRSSIECLSNRLLEVGSVVTVVGESNQFTVAAHTGSTYQLKPLFSMQNLNQLLEQAGQTPLPPYLKHSPLKEAERRSRYQSVFAKAGDSAAAPTASLHMTPELLTQLKAAGITVVHVRLDVSLGTFAPLTEEQLKAGSLHAERYSISTATAKVINEAIKKDLPIIPVGTTALRALESAAVNGKLVSGRGTTKIFIRPGYTFQICSGLITNFHVPESSLMMLVASMVGRKRLLSLYQKALAWGFSFLSFGDAMIVLPKGRRVGEKSEKQQKAQVLQKKNRKNIPLK